MYLVAFGMAIAILLLSIYDTCYFIGSEGRSIPFVHDWVGFIPPVALLVVGLLTFDIPTLSFMSGMCVGYCLYQVGKWMYFTRD